MSAKIIYHACHWRPQQLSRHWYEDCTLQIEHYFEGFRCYLGKFVKSIVSLFGREGSSWITQGYLLFGSRLNSQEDVWEVVDRV